MRGRRAFQLAAAAASVLALLLGGSASSYGPTPTTTWVVSGGELGGGGVEAVAVSGSTAYVGGNFGYMGPETGSFVSLDTQGALTTPWPTVGGDVYAVAPDGTGGWFIGGEFASIGTHHADNLAHIRSDGTLDTDWAGGTNGSVFALTASADTVYAGGLFSFAAGVPRTGLAAFGATTGVVTGFDPGVNGDGAFVSALELSGSTLYVGGLFDALGGAERENLGAVTTSGLTAGSVTPWNPEVDALVNAITVPAPGTTVYVGGFFDNVNDDTHRNNAAAFDAAGTGTATAWNPDPDAEVYALKVSGSTVYLGGAFETLAGMPRLSLGAVDTASGTTATAWNPKVTGTVFQLAVVGSTVYAAGSFQSVAGPAVPRDNLAAFSTASTGAAAAFHPMIGGDAYALGAAGGKVVVGGAFRTAGPTPVRRDNLGAIDLTTGQATSWDPLANDSVTALAVTGTTVYAGGFFTTVNGTAARNRLASFPLASSTATNWNPGANGSVLALTTLGSNVYAGGSFTTVNGSVARNRLAAFATTGTGSALAWNPNANGTVYALDASGTTIYAGGDFTTVGGVTRTRLASVGFNGALTQWSPNANDTVYALAHSGSTEYAGGAFTMVNATVPRAGAAAFANSGAGGATDWNPSVGLDSTTPGVVYALAPTASTMYLAGIFHRIGACPTPCLFSPALAAVSLATGASLSTWQPVANELVDALAIAPQGLVVGGQFTALGYPPPGAAYNPVEPDATYRGGFALLRAFPEAPIVSAAPGEGSASVSITPTYLGGAAVTSYTVTATPGGATETSATSPITVGGLTNGTLYTFAVTLTTSVGTSPPGVSNAVTPRTTPGAPTGVTAVPADGRASVGFVPPASDGGEAVGSYTVTASPGNATATGTESPIVVFGLTNDMPYTFTVTAANSAGAGPASAPSDPVVPVEGGRPHPTPPTAPRPDVPDVPAITTPRTPPTHHSP